MGQSLADSLGKKFIDSDQEIVRSAGMEVSTIFSRAGEVAFRKYENAVLQQLTVMNNIVLATGGGAVLDAANRSCLSANGTIIYLRAKPELLYRRLCLMQDRPLLQVSEPAKELAKLLQQREPLYQQLADCIVDVADKSVTTIVTEIMAQQ